MSRVSSAAISPADLRAMAVKASCDPRTIGRYLAGGSQPSTTIQRVEAALVAAGRGDLVRTSQRCAG